MKSWIVHYRNKYPGGQVQASENSLDVYNAQGEHCVALRKSGAGQWVDESESFGCKDKHCLAPIPKESRLFKEKAGKIVQDEEFSSRSEKVKDFCHEGRVLSCEELGSSGMKFDEKQRLVK